MDVTLHALEGLGHIAHNVRMSGIEADADIVEMGCANELNQSVWNGEVIRNIFEQHADSKRLGKSAQMFDRCHGRFKLALVVGLVGDADMLDQEAKRNLLRKFNSPLDFIHRLDSRSPVRGSDIDWRGPSPSPFVIGVERCVDRMQRNATRPKAVSDL